MSPAEGALQQRPFEPSAIHHLVYFIVNSLGREVGAIELMKLVYLIDVGCWRLFGRTLTGLEYVRQKKGPFSAAVNDAVTDMIGFELTQEIRSTRTDYPKHACRPGDRPRFTPGFSPIDQEIIRQTLREIGPKSVGDLEKLAYETEPMATIIDLERRTGEKLLNEKLNFGLLKRDEFVLRWLKNRALLRDVPVDPDYQRELEADRIAVGRYFGTNA